ncbi:MAG TPA: MEDS domain-containing protein [Bacteroidia bacterium]|jgi:hypothetical protein|nr:MEDS domain-containing protein [Bacteroidia bacterium]
MKNKSFCVCGERFSNPMHICAFFDSQQEQYDVITPYIKEGLAGNEQVINILEANIHSQHREHLKGAGISVEKKLANNQLKILSADETYLKGGSFAAEKMYHLLEEALIESQNDGFENLRACGDMVWALKNVRGTDELMEYEARLNQLVPKYFCSLICMYDINRFSGRAIADILETHPYVILNGKIHKNPHYIEPLTFLQSLLKRKKRTLKADESGFTRTHLYS